MCVIKNCSIVCKICTQHSILYSILNFHFPFPHFPFPDIPFSISSFLTFAFRVTPRRAGKVLRMRNPTCTSNLVGHLWICWSEKFGSLCGAKGKHSVNEQGEWSLVEGEALHQRREERHLERRRLEQVSRKVNK